MKIESIGLIAFGILIGFLVAFGYNLYGDYEQNKRLPNCPTEDSCVAQYNGHTNRWEIYEVTP